MIGWSKNKMTLKKTFSVSFLVRLTGIEHAFLSKMEPNRRVTLVEDFCAYLSIIS
jgi:hypothetical protein